MNRVSLLVACAAGLGLVVLALACGGRNVSGTNEPAGSPGGAATLSTSPPQTPEAVEPLLADWPEATPGEESDASTGIVSDVLAKMPPTLLVSDAFIQPGDTARIPVRLGRGFGSTTFKTYGGYTVAVADAGGKEIQRERTDQDGRLVFEQKFEKAGNFFFRAAVDGRVEEKDVRPALFCVYVRAKDAPIAICDLDKTLVKSGFFRVVVGGAEPFDHAADVVNRLVKEKRMTVLYLTHRPDFFAASSRHWLRANRFPPGPLYTGDLAALLTGSGAFKAEEIARLKQRFANLKLGIGDKYSDTDAYLENKIRPVLIPDIDWGKKKLEYWQEQHSQLAALKADVTVCRDWFEIEEALFGGKEFPPARLLGPIKDMIQALERGP